MPFSVICIYGILPIISENDNNSDEWRDVMCVNSEKKGKLLLALNQRVDIIFQNKFINVLLTDTNNY